MTTNPYINNFTSTEQQSLAANLVQEAIRFYGYDVQYLPRTNLNYDEVNHESTNVAFNSSFDMEMYIRSIDGYGGQGQFLSHIGIEIRNQIVFSVSMKSWEESSDVPDNRRPRPQEGDLIYFALDHKLMEIKKVNRYDMFYQMGTLYTWDLTCEVFEYSGETLNTGIERVDAIGQTLSINTNEQGSVVGGVPIFNNDFEFLDKFASNEKIDGETQDWIDFTEDDPFNRSF